MQNEQVDVLELQTRRAQRLPNRLRESSNRVLEDRSPFHFRIVPSIAQHLGVDSGPVATTRHLQP